MPRPSRKQRRLALPPEPDAAALPRYLTGEQCAEVHRQWFGPAEDRTIKETWGLRWHISNARRVTRSIPFLVEAQRRFDAGRVVIGSRQKATSAQVPNPSPADDFVKA